MGLTQGITELFPVSSLGHSVLLPGLLGWHNLVNSQSASESFFLAFIVGLHVGTALGLLIYYRKTWIVLFRGLGRQLAGVRGAGVSSLWRLDEPDTDPNYRLLFVLAVATVPVGIVGLLLEHKLRVLFAKPLAAAIFLTINGVILLVGERLRRSSGRHVQHKKLERLSTTRCLRHRLLADLRALRRYLAQRYLDGRRIDGRARPRRVGELRVPVGDTGHLARRRTQTARLDGALRRRRALPDAGGRRSAPW